MPAAAASGPKMEARALLEGHTRPGGWMAIAVDLRNEGPPISGELRLLDAEPTQTRYAVAVDLPTTSAKSYVLYARPPVFGADLEVGLVADRQVVARAPIRYQLHDPSRPLVGIVSEDPGSMAAAIDLPDAVNQAAPVVVGLSPSSLPDRVEGWAALDHLVWQDIDTAILTPEQRDAMEAWIAAGGRLIITGGTAGPGVLSALPDELLPYRPTATIDAEPAVLAGMLGKPPARATPVPVLAGTLTAGRALATSGDRVIAAERSIGEGAVTILGFDPTTPWIRDQPTVSGLWQRFLPGRAGAAAAGGDDSQVLGAVGTVAAIALPPVEGLLALLVGYIALVGPVNYLVLRRIDRREWAWFTIPALIALFAVGAFAYGAALRGSDILINEVAIVRGSAGVREATAVGYYGVFSPRRASYSLVVDDGALLSAPINGEFFGSPTGTGAGLDILQGRPSRVRDLAVAVGGFRVVRAESPVDGPELDIDARIVDGTLSGVVRNASDRAIEDAVFVVGTTVAHLGDLPAGGSATIPSTRLDSTTCCVPLSERVVGPQVFEPRPGGADTSQQAQASQVRYSLVNQLTWEPRFGANWSLPGGGAAVLGWSGDPLLPVRIDGQDARRTSTLLYVVRAPVEVEGRMTFRNDLLRSAIVDSDSPFFSKSPWQLEFGRGTATVSYRPFDVGRSFEARRLTAAINTGPDVPAGQPTTKVAAIGPAPDEATGCDAEPCPTPSPGPSEAPGPDPVPPEPIPPEVVDNLPEVELFDIVDGRWMAFPHLGNGVFEFEDPARYVDPSSGEVLFRFRNDIVDQMGFSYFPAIEVDLR